MRSPSEIRDDMTSLEAQIAPLREQLQLKQNEASDIERRINDDVIKQGQLQNELAQSELVYNHNKEVQDKLDATLSLFISFDSIPIYSTIEKDDIFEYNSNIYLTRNDVIKEEATDPEKDTDNFSRVFQIYKLAPDNE